jgi:hypothetical protein
MRLGSTRLTRLLGRLLPLVVLPACASLVPLREPPLLATEEPPGPATTRAEVIARFGPPQEVRASDLGEVLVYRRLVVRDLNPNRYYGEDRGDQFTRYDRVMIYLDDSGRIVRWSVEAE